VLTIDGSEAFVRDATVSFDNQLIEMPRLGSRLNRQPLDGRAVVTGTFRKEFEDTTIYDKFVSGQSATYSLKFTGKNYAGASTNRDLEFKFDAIHYTAATPNVPGPDPIPQEVSWEVRDDGTADGGIEVILKNDTASYT